MSLNFLDFEQPIAELEAKIDSLTAVSRQDEKLDINIDEEVHRLREKRRADAQDLRRSWCMAGCATGSPSTSPIHPGLCPPGFRRIRRTGGDRAYADDKAIVGGIARLDGRPVMIIGHQKGREPKRKFAATSVCRRRKAIVRRCA